MARPKGSSALERTFQVGWYFYWKQATYLILEVDPDQYQRLRAINVASREERWLWAQDLMLAPEHHSIPFLAASTLEELHQLIERHHPRPESAPESGISPSLLARADQIIATIKEVEDIVAEIKRQVNRYAGRTQGETKRLDKQTRDLLRVHTGKCKQAITVKYKREKALRQACQRLSVPLGLTSYYKYSKAYKKYNGDRVRLAASLHRRTFHVKRINKAQLHFLDTIIPLYYRRDSKIGPYTIYRLADSALKHHTQYLWIDPAKCGTRVPEDLIAQMLLVLNQELSIKAILANPEKAKLLSKITLPARGLFYEYYKWFESDPEIGREELNKRYGSGTWERYYQVFDSFAHRASFPLQYVFGDHCLLDCFIVDEATRSQLSRLWLTLLIDAYSRSILGMVLLYEEPCIESIQGALFHAIWPKTSHTALGIEGDWVCFGIPQHFSLDNAMAHHSVSLKQLARDIGDEGKYHTIELVWRPPYRARNGALIERVIGNISNRTKQEFPGAIRSSNPKDVEQAKREACALYGDLDRFLHRVIVEYQNTPHSALGGMTPNQKWIQGMRGGWPRIPDLTKDVKRLFLRKSTETRTINSGAICLFGMHYRSKDLDKAPRLEKGEPIKYSFRYDPSNISWLAIYNEAEYVCDVEADELRLPDDSLRSTSLWEMEMAKDFAKDLYGDTRDWVSILNEKWKLMAQRKKEKTKIQRELRHAKETSQEEAPEETRSPEVVPTLSGVDLATQLLIASQS